MKKPFGVLAFFCNEVAYYDGQHYTALITRPLEMFGSLANFFEKLYLMIPVKHSDSPVGTKPPPLVWDKTEIVHLPYFAGDALKSASGPLSFPWICLQAGSQMVKVIRKADVVGATVPSLMGNLTSHLAMLMRKPVFHFVRADKKAHLAAVHPHGFSHFFYQCASSGLEAYAKWAVGHGVPTFVVGGGLFKKYSPSVKPKSHLFISTPVLTAVFQPSPGDLRQKPRSDRPRLLYVGRLSKEKRVDDLLHGVDILRRHHGIEPEVAIVGDGPERRDLEQLAAQLQLENVHFKGLVEYGPKLTAFYHWADIFVLPSIVESLGAVLAEAMACGVPVVATNVDGIPTIVNHKWNGLLVPPLSPKNLAESIAQIVQSPDLWHYLSQNAISTAKNFTVESEITKLVDIVRRTCFTTAK